MKSIFIKSSVQYVLDILGESWQQGDCVSGIVSMVQLNHSSQPEHTDQVSQDKPQDYHLILAYGDHKKIKKKATNAFKIVNELTSNKEKMSFDFDLGSNCSISESTGAMYLILCLEKNRIFDGTLLELKITPNKIITSFIQIFENFFRFKIKNLKNKKSWIEAKVVVPDSKEFLPVQQLNLQLRMKEENLELNFIFKLKKMVLEGSVMTTKDLTLEIHKSLSPREYQYRENAPNQEAICKIIQNILDEIKLRPIV